MNCREAERHIFAERDGVLDESARKALAGHLATCAACRRIRDDFEHGVGYWRAANAMIPVPDPAFEWRKLERGINQAARPARRERALWVALPTAMAAAAALAAYYVAPGSRPAGPKAATAPLVANAAAAVAEPPQSSTVIYVDDKSGWTFVWSPDSSGNERRI